VINYKLGPLYHGQNDLRVDTEQEVGLLTYTAKFYVVTTVYFGMKLYNDQRNAECRYKTYAHRVSVGKPEEKDTTWNT
jgi:hypothetical protein